MGGERGAASANHRVVAQHRKGSRPNERCAWMRRGKVTAFNESYPFNRLPAREALRILALRQPDNQHNRYHQHQQRQTTVLLRLRFG